MQKVAKAILSVMKEVGYIQKEKKSGVSFLVKSEQAILSAIRPLMLENDLIMVPVGIEDTKWNQNEVLNRAGKTIMSNQFQGVFTYRVIHTVSGESIDVKVMGSGESRGDDKAPYMANTGSKKYALLDTFLMETGDDPDNHDYEDEDEDEPSSAKKSSSRKKPAKQTDEEATPIEQKHIDELDGQIQKAEALGVSIEDVDYTDMTVGHWRKAWSKVVDSIEANQKNVDEDDIPF